MSAEVAAVLREARALIDDPAHWIKGAGSAVINGVDCYCAIGAADAAADRRDHFDIWSDCAYEAIRNALPFGWNAVGDFNDSASTTHADVLALFDRAIAAEESQP